MKRSTIPQRLGFSLLCLSFLALVAGLSAAVFIAVVNTLSLPVWSPVALVLTAIVGATPYMRRKWLGIVTSLGLAVALVILVARGQTQAEEPTMKIECVPAKEPRIQIEIVPLERPKAVEL